MSADVAIIIVTYNSEEQIGGCLETLHTQRNHVSQQIIVLDNHSLDGTVELVRRRFPDVKLMLPGRNLGFGAGCNFAVRHTDAEFILLLNPDTEILDHGVDVVVDFARAHPEYGIYGGRAFRPDGRLEQSSCWGAPSLRSYAMFAFGLSTLFRRNRFFDPESLGSWPRDTVREVGVITGCFLLTARSLWNALGGFDERYFMYGEDADLSMRARKAGHRPVICPDAKYVHEVGQSSASRTDKALLLYRGKACYVRTHWAGLKGVFGLSLLKLGVGLRALGGILAKQSGKSVWVQLWKERARWSLGYPSATACEQEVELATVG